MDTIKHKVEEYKNGIKKVTEYFGVSEHFGVESDGLYQLSRITQNKHYPFNNNKYFYY
jgi:hypothetical protein